MGYVKTKTRNELKEEHINKLQEKNNKLLVQNIKLEEKYNLLAEFSIKTAFHDWNTNVEDLMRILRKLNLIQFDAEKQVYINPNYNKDKLYNDLNDISEEKDKTFEIKDDELDDYTKQLESKLNQIKEIFKMDLEYEKNKEFLSEEGK